MVQYLRSGVDPYPMFGWQRIQLEGQQALYKSPSGEVFDDLQHAYEYEVASKSAQTGVPETKVGLSFLQKFLKDCGGEEQEVAFDDTRILLTTSTLEDEVGLFIKVKFKSDGLS